MLAWILTIVMIILFYFETLLLFHKDGPTNFSSYFYSFSGPKKETSTQIFKNAPQNYVFLAPTELKKCKITSVRPSVIIFDFRVTKGPLC